MMNGTRRLRREDYLRKWKQKSWNVRTINITLIYIAPALAMRLGSPFYLNDKQVETIKDAMTYNLFHIRYDDFMDLLPNLTESDKNRVYHWLVEARKMKNK